MSIAILVSEHLPMLSARPKLRMNHLERFAYEFAQQFVPELNRQPRGNVLAAEYMLKALISFAAPEPVLLFVAPRLKRSLEHLVSVGAFGSKICQVHSLEDVLYKGIDAYNIRVWFNPFPVASSTEGSEISQRIRSVYGSRVYPVVTLFHGLSIHTVLYDCISKLLLEGSYPCDSFVLTSNASQKAMKLIIEHITTSYAQQLQADVHFTGRIDLIPLAIDTQRFSPQDKRLSRRLFQFSEKAFVILYIGKISPLKADLLPTLRMFKTLCTQNTRPLLLVIAGTQENGYADILREETRALEIEKTVKFILDVPEERKAALLSSADVFVSPSDSVQESFGLTPVEAMSCGTPQVVPDWDGYRDTVDHGVTGFKVGTYWTQCDGDLLNSGAICAWMFDHFSLGQSIAINTNETGKYIQMLIDDTLLHGRLAENSRKRAIELYSADTVARQYKVLCDSLTLQAVEVKVRNKPPLYSLPAYNKCFGHYASSVLTDGSILRVVNKITDKTRIKLTNVPRIMVGYEILDENLLNDLLGAARANASENITIGSLRESINTPHGQQDRATRHIMWLIKYGFLEPSTV